MSDLRDIAVFVRGTRGLCIHAQYGGGEPLAGVRRKNQKDKPCARCRGTSSSAVTRRQVKRPSIRSACLGAKLWVTTEYFMVFLTNVKIVPMAGIEKHEDALPAIKNIASELDERKNRRTFFCERPFFPPKDGATMFKDLFETGKNTAINALLSNKSALALVNGKISRYGEVLSLRYDENGLHADARLLGSSETIRVSVQKLIFTDECSAVKLCGFSSSAQWCQHLLEDFVEGKAFDIPAEARPFLKPLAKFF